MRILLGLAIGLSALWKTPVATAASTVKAPHVEVSLVSADQALPRGGKSWWGVFFKIDPHWHVYWKNPGDSGAAPKFNLTVQGGQLGPVQWPVPHRLPLGEFVNFGYEKEVLYPFDVRAKEGPEVKVQAKLEWLVCREECVPGFATLELSRPVQAEARVDAQWTSAFTETLSRLPSAVLAGKLSGRATSPETYELSFAPLDQKALEVWTVFPVNGEKFLPQEPTREIKESQIKWSFRTQSVAPLGTPSFVLSNGKSAHESAVAAEDTEPLALLLLFAFLGGVILNLMPCVFPVLSIKVFSLMKESGGGRAAMAREGFLYTAGVLVTFLGLGAVFLILRQGGESVGWGFQLQSPTVVYLLMLLFFALALNFLGVFEWGTALMNWAGLRSSSSHGVGTFGTGALSVFVAAPCTGPFMGAALGAAVSLPAVPAMGLFFALGLGLAAPVLLLCLIPGGLKWLPRPGAWMETLKEFFAFPLFATVLWLWWVLTQQTGDGAILIGGGGFLLLSWGLWIRFQNWKRIPRTLLITAAVLVPVVLFKYETSAEKNLSHGAVWEFYDEKLLNEARAGNQAVFVDFTAAWCITCQWNKKAVLETSTAQDLFKQQNVLLLQGDWTRYDEKITKALAVFGRASVPLYVYYPAGGGEPRILPQMLTMSMIQELFPSNQGGQK